MSDEPAPAAPTRPAKSAAAFRTIGEAADDLGLPPHVLRFWESKFPQLKPLKRGGGRRYYRPEDIALLRWIQHYLYRNGYTIRGVQKLLDGTVPAGDVPTADWAAANFAAPSPLVRFGKAADADPAAPAPAAGSPGRLPPPIRQPRRRPRQSIAGEPNARTAALQEIRRELREARTLVEKLLRPRKGGGGGGSSGRDEGWG